MKSLYIYCGQFSIRKLTQSHGINEAYVHNFLKAATSLFEKVYLYGGSSLSESSLFSKESDRFIIDPSVDYLFKNNDPRLYEKFLDLAIDHSEAILFIPRLTHPDFYTQNYCFVINLPLVIFIFQFSLLSLFQNLEQDL